MNKNNNNKDINKALLIILLGALAALGPLSIDMYIPGFEQMAKEFGTDVSELAFTITSYFIGITIGQLAYGPLIDKYGRRKPLLYALVLYIAASLGCAFSTSLELMTTLRFFQALGGSAGMVSGLAIISDTYEPDKRAKAFSLIMLVMGVAPILAPSGGSFLVKHFRWQTVFYFLVVFSVILVLVVYFFLPETGKYMYSGKLKVKKALKDYMTITKSKTFLFYALGGSIANSILFAYVASSPFVFMTYYGVSPTVFAVLYGINAGGVLLGNYANSLLTKKYHYINIMNIISVVLAALAVPFAVLIYFYPTIPFEWVVVGIFLLEFCIGITYPNAVSASLAPFKELSGSASALNGSFMMGFSAIVTAVIGVLAASSAFTMVAVMAMLAILTVIFLQIARRFAPKDEPN